MLKCKGCNNKFVKNGKQVFCDIKCRLKYYRSLPSSKEKFLISQKLWKTKNKDYAKNWAELNPEKIKKYQKKYYKNNKEKRIAYHLMWVKNNLEKVKKYRKNYRNNNIEKIREKERMWYKNNPKKAFIIAKRKRNKKRSTPHGKIRHSISNLIRIRLKKRLSSKKGKATFNFLPYTIDDLIKHLEQQFTKGMTWDNYGKWHIDHIKPDSLFNYKLVEDKEFQECWALENLQPMWAEDNRKKGNRYEE